MKRFLLILALLLIATDAFGCCGLFSRISARRAARLSARHHAAAHTVSYHTTTIAPATPAGCGCNCANCACSPAPNTSSQMRYYPETTTRIVYAVPSPQEIRQAVTTVPNYPYAVPTRFTYGNCPGGVCPIP